MIRERDTLAQHYLVKSSFLETIKAKDGEVFHMPYHQKRYEDVLKSYGMWESQDLSSFINPPKDGLYRCRVVYTPQSPHAIDVTYHKYTKRKISSLKLVYDDFIDYSKKSTCREDIDKLYEQRGSCDDILIVKQGFITDTSIANIAFKFDGMWITPKEPLLKGTTRQRLLDDGKIIQKDIKVQELHKVQTTALLNAMIDFDIITDISFI